VAKYGKPDDLLVLPIDESGSLSPLMLEKLIPALSKKSPSSIITECPVPKPFFSHKSLIIF